MNNEEMVKKVYSLLKFIFAGFSMSNENIDMPAVYNFSKELCDLSNEELYPLKIEELDYIRGLFCIIKDDSEEITDLNVDKIFSVIYRYCYLLDNKDKFPNCDIDKEIEKIREKDIKGIFENFKGKELEENTKKKKKK